MSHLELEKGLTFSQNEDQETPLVLNKFPISIKNFYIRRRRLITLILSILIGQILAVLTAMTGVSSTMISNANISLPLSQNLPHSMMLAASFGQFIIFRQCKSHCSPNQVLLETQFYTPPDPYFMRFNWWKYLLASILDVHANWAMVAAFQYTNVVSIQIIDCFAIGSAMFLSKLAFKVRYTLIHYLAVIGCFIGIVVLILADIYHSLASSEFKFNKKILLGDFLALLGATMYGANNVIQQHLAQKNGSTNYLGFTSIISAVLLAIYCGSMESEKIRELISTFDQIPASAKWGFLLYAVCMFTLYSFMTLGLRYTNAVFVNLNLLATDVYALFLGIFFFGHKFIGMYILAFIIILSCAFIFLMKEPKRQEEVS